MIRNYFYFTLKLLFVLKIFHFFPDIFGHVTKRLNKISKFNFQIYDAINWESNNYNVTIHITQFARSTANQKIKFGDLIEYNVRKIILQK